MPRSGQRHPSFSSIWLHHHQQKLLCALQHNSLPITPKLEASDSHRYCPQQWRPQSCHESVTLPILYTLSSPFPTCYVRPQITSQNFLIFSIISDFRLKNSNGSPSHLPNPPRPTVHAKTQQLLYQHLQRSILHHAPALLPSLHSHRNPVPVSSCNLGDSRFTPESVAPSFSLRTSC